jgi:NADPH:quinone reductase-like Zn-dependent oxidoreductase
VFKEKKMKAIVQVKYGPPGEVLELRETDKPEIEDDEVLVRVRAASVHPDVWHVVRGLPYVLRLMRAGLLEPKNRVPGTDVAGHVESVGKNVTQFQQGAKKDQLVVLKDLLEDGKIIPVIHRTYPLSEAPEAIRYLEEGHVRGKVIITP